MKKKELIEILLQDVTQECPEFFDKMMDKLMREMTIEDVLLEFLKAGHKIEYIGGGLFLFKYV